MPAVVSGESIFVIYTGEMNPVSQTAASLVVFVLAITANDWIRDGARFVA